MARVWVTRTRPGAEATARRLRRLGHTALVQPLLAAEAVGAGPIDLSGVAALAFTSGQAVAAFAARSPERSLPVFTVGAATARRARAAGFARVEALGGDVGAMAPLLAARAGGGLVLHLAAAQPAGDLAGDLARRGAAVRTEVVYRTIARRPSERFLKRLADLDAALIHSARAGAVLAEILHETPAPHLRLLGLSEAALAPLAAIPARERRAAALPEEASLLSLV